MTNTSQGTEWLQSLPNFMQWPVKSCSAQTFILTLRFLISDSVTYSYCLRKKKLRMVVKSFFLPSMYYQHVTSVHAFNKEVLIICYMKREWHTLQNKPGDITLMQGSAQDDLSGG